MPTSSSTSQRGTRRRARPPWEKRTTGLERPNTGCELLIAKRGPYLEPGYGLKHDVQAFEATFTGLADAQPRARRPSAQRRPPATSSARDRRQTSRPEPRRLDRRTAAPR